MSAANLKSSPGRTAILWAIACLALLMLFSSAGQAQSAASAMLQQFQAVRNQWFAAVSGPANNLFALLAMIEFAWSAALLLLEKTDLQGFTAGVVRRLMFIGAFYTLLQFGPKWIPAIIDSFETIGQQAAASGPLAPGAVFGRGLDIAGNLFQAASQAGFFQNMGTALALVLAAILAFLAFVGITIQFVVAMVESYIVVGAGFIFLGFGGSRWTSSYVERYIALAVSVGVKILVLYLLIAAGMQVSMGWANDASLVANQQDPAMSAWDIAGGALIFLALCWQTPKLTSGILGGAPTLSGGDLVSAGGAVAIGGLAVASVAAGGVAMAARMAAAQGATSAVGSAAGPSTGGSGGASTAGGTGASVPPPKNSGGSGAGGVSSVGSASMRGAGNNASDAASAASISGAPLPTVGTAEGPTAGYRAPAGSAANSTSQPTGPVSDSTANLAYVAPPPASMRARSTMAAPAGVSVASGSNAMEGTSAVVAEVAPGADQVADDSVPGGGSSIGAMVSRLGHGVSKVATWSATSLRWTAFATRRARYTIPHDVPPPPPPPPPMKTTEESE